MSASTALTSMTSTPKSTNSSEKTNFNRQDSAVSTVAPPTPGGSTGGGSGGGRLVRQSNMTARTVLSLPGAYLVTPGSGSAGVSRNSTNQDSDDDGGHNVATQVRHLGNDHRGISSDHIIVGNGNDDDNCNTRSQRLNTSNQLQSSLEQFVVAARLSPGQGGDDDNDDDEDEECPRSNDDGSAPLAHSVVWSSIHSDTFSSMIRSKAFVRFLLLLLLVIVCLFGIVVLAFRRNPNTTTATTIVIGGGGTTDPDGNGAGGITSPTLAPVQEQPDVVGGAVGDTLPPTGSPSNSPVVNGAPTSTPAPVPALRPTPVPTRDEAQNDCISDSETLEFAFRNKLPSVILCVGTIHILPLYGQSYVDFWETTVHVSCESGGSAMTEGNQCIIDVGEYWFANFGSNTDLTFDGITFTASAVSVTEYHAAVRLWN